jgi:hypothetical protein
MNIPRILHFIWYQGFDDLTFTADLKTNITLWKEKNPDWTIRLWDEASLSKMIQDRYPNMYGCWKNLDRLIKKCDFARCLLMHEYGGVAVDCDCVPLRSLNDFLCDTTMYYEKQFLTSRIFEPSPYEYYPHHEFARPVNLDNYSVLLSVENFRCDDYHKTAPVATCVVVSKPHADLWIQFLGYAVPFRQSKTLSAFGSHRFGVFMANYYHNAKSRDVLIMPSYYTMFDQAWYGHAVDKDFALSSHAFNVSWGDLSFSDYKKYEV